MLPHHYPTPTTEGGSLKNQVMAKHEDALLAYPGDLGSAGMSPCRANKGSKLFSPSPFFSLFLFICPLTVSSLNLINLSEGAPGKCDTEVGVIAEYAGRGGWGVVGGTWILAWGQAAVWGFPGSLAMNTTSTVQS